VATSTLGAFARRLVNFQRLAATVQEGLLLATYS
jgi:hypothetical protein